MSSPEQGESIDPPVSGLSKGAQIAIGASLAIIEMILWQHVVFGLIVALKSPTLGIWWKRSPSQ